MNSSVLWICSARSLKSPLDIVLQGAVLWIWFCKDLEQFCGYCAARNLNSPADMVLLGA